MFRSLKNQKITLLLFFISICFKLVPKNIFVCKFLPIYGFSKIKKSVATFTIIIL